MENPALVMKSPKLTMEEEKSPAGFPVHIPYSQKYVMIPICDPCLKETHRRIKMTSDGGQLATFSLCPKCVQRNRIMSTLFNKKVK